ncbi:MULTISPECIES: disulfide bond formation protein B [unclassified Francisella]|uniref:disulfide bond formation protein B n=1 Tax=unclassified Francisella TaxID=2610885 RepID=UPI002E332F57|nr:MULTISPECIES: disulfide bond formation protein B [unclassified Francisella]MED7818520.1 disulfide bond formation protein B [Francisella sp. 19S2-4]MED7829356.1 disulfide bond formation protein B [Francisella sp. 19S2-10]
MKQNILDFFDSIALIGICVVLTSAFYYQIFLSELPCALCVFQRMALSLISFGIILNLIHGNKSEHYFFVILVALLNSAMAITQILLHIVPGTGSYGDAVFSLHMYTWNFIISIIFILYSTICGLITSNQEKIKKGNNILVKIAVILIICLTLANTISVLIECGPHLCPSDPNNYWLLEVFSK